MAPRPKEAPPDRRGEILKAALRVFARRGYAAATNAEIAKEAGVTAAALYYYFPSKSELFKAAVSERRDQILPILQQAAPLSDAPPDEALAYILQHVVAFLTDESTQSILRIVMAEGPRNPEIAEIYHSQVIGMVAPVLFGFLGEQMQAGRLRQVDPRIIAMGLLGPVMMTVFARDLLNLPIIASLTNEQLTAGLSELVTHGLVTSPRGE